MSLDCGTPTTSQVTHQRNTPYKCWEKLRLLRLVKVGLEQRTISQTKLCQEMGLAGNKDSQYGADRNYPEVTNLLYSAKHQGVPIDHIVTGNL